MARPQKFRHSREALNDPQIAAKLGGFVLDIEALRTTRKQIDDQIAAAYDAVGDAGFEKKFVRKVVSLRAKETDARRDEEEGLEAYKFAVEKGVSLASARSKPVSSQSYAEAKGRETTTPKASNSKASVAETADLATTPSELTDTQPEEENSPSPANAPRLAADDEAAQANPIVVGTHSNPQPTSLGNAEQAGAASSSTAPATLSEKKDCLKLKDGHCKISFDTPALCAVCNAERMKARAA